MYVYHGGAGGLASTPADRLDSPGDARAAFVALARAGDLEGDGFPEVAVQLTSDPRLYIYRGGPRGLDPVPGWQREPAPMGQGSHVRARSVGDFNGDGYGDLFTSEDSNRATRLRLFLGHAEGPSRWAVVGELPERGFYYAIDPAGDVNGDGLGDLVAVPYGPVVPASARLHVYHGTRSGFIGRDEMLPPPAASLANPGRPGDTFGARVAGDYDGDGFADLAVVIQAATPGARQVVVYRGSSTGLRSPPAVTLVAPNGRSEGFGLDLASGDFDGDGFADLAVGAEDGIHVFPGGASGPDAAQRRGVPGDPDPAERRTGQLLLTADFNRDGFSDLVVSLPQALGGLGRFHVYQGGPRGLASAPSLTVDCPDAIRRFGASLALVLETHPAGEVMRPPWRLA